MRRRQRRVLRAADRPDGARRSTKPSGVRSRARSCRWRRRCSVHCKSDITHKLNRNEATPEDILHTLHDSMASKVVALLEKGQRELRRVLVIGGVSRNAAMLAALREKLPATEFVVLPESPWFEAWGTRPARRAMSRSTGRRRSPLQPSLGSLPPLQPLRRPGAGHRRAAAAGAARRPAGARASMRDRRRPRRSCSTQPPAASWPRTTRAPAAIPWRRRGSACGRWPTRSATGRVALVATTGSARELVGAYLGTGHVYNEISAHAAGATHFDPDVDTIFEIGGQDSKYIYLRNGVPIDYAMNNACSAGTGSFLEESAQGDLGIGVADIADVALAAPSPVQFKATCAAFINSDIRIAQQQGTRARTSSPGWSMRSPPTTSTGSRARAASARRCSCRAAWP